MVDDGTGATYTYEDFGEAGRLEHTDGKSQACRCVKLADQAAPCSWQGSLADVQCLAQK